MSKKNEFDNFDEFAHDYRQIHGSQTQSLGVESDYFADLKVQQVLREEKKFADKPLRILDYGCGDGVVEPFFARYFPLAKVTGIDVSEESIEIARSKNLPNAEYLAFDGKGSLPFNDGSFDIIFVAMVLHHINHKTHASVFKEFHRVLSPGGRIYIFEHNPFNPVTRYFVNTCPFDKDAHLVLPLSLKKGLKLQGFKNIVNQYIFFFPRIGLFKPFLFTENYLRWLFLGGQYYAKAVKN